MDEFCHSNNNYNNNHDFVTSLSKLSIRQLVITPNQRLANSLLQQHAVQQNQSCWPRANMMSFNQWLRQLWQDYQFVLPKKLLNPNEETLIWQQIVQQQAREHTLINPNKTAELIQQAWQHLTHWCLDLTSITPEQLQQNQNTQLFKQCAKQFQQYCQTEQLIDSATALTIIGKDLEFLANLAYETIYFYEFLAFDPLQASLITQLKQANITIHYIHTNTHNKQTKQQRYEFNTSEQELLAMAHWAKQLNQTATSKKNTGIIGCVVPNLHQIREPVLRAFKQVFNTTQAPIDCSAGQKLSDFPIIQFVLTSIVITSPGEHDFELFSALLRSPFWTQAEQELSWRMQLDHELRARCHSQLSLTNFISKLTAAIHQLTHTNTNINIKSDNIFLLFNLLHDYAKASTKQNQLNQFSQQLLQLLTKLGWPGERTLDSTEYQVSQRFTKLLDELTGLIHFIQNQKQSTINTHQIKTLLQQLCRHTEFQIETEKTRIQILGLLEASGMQFEHLWIMGLDDLTWPSKPQANPFLPFQLQAKQQMPHATAEREYEFCRQLTQQLISNSQQFIASSAQQQQDKTLRPSALIANLPLAIWPDLSNKTNNKTNNKINNKTINKTAITIISDSHGPAIRANELIQGGTEILRRQSICPFQAFASLRLGATGLATTQDAPDALVRGSLLHKALELFWTQVSNQTQLNQLSKVELDQLLDQSAQQALIALRQQPFSPLMLDIEHQRLKKLIQQTIALEQQRNNFKIYALEQNNHYQFGELVIQFKADRIDQLANGQKVIIDYKTGLPTMNHWFGARPKEPQLLLYCISEPAVDTLIFAQVRHNHCQFKGISANPDHFSATLSTVKPITQYHHNWAEQVAEWTTIINQLISDFSQGDASVDPVDPSVCTLCELHSLCRVHSDLSEFESAIAGQ